MVSFLPGAAQQSLMRLLSEVTGFYGLCPAGRWKEAGLASGPIAGGSFPLPREGGAWVRLCPPTPGLPGPPVAAGRWAPVIQGEETLTSLPIVRQLCYHNHGSI